MNSFFCGLCRIMEERWDESELYSWPLHMEVLLIRYLEIWVIMSCVKCGNSGLSPVISLLEAMKNGGSTGCCSLLYWLIVFFFFLNGKCILFRRITLWCHSFPLIFVYEWLSCHYCGYLFTWFFSFWVGIFFYSLLSIRCPKVLAWISRKNIQRHYWLIIHAI